MLKEEVGEQVSLFGISVGLWLIKLNWAWGEAAELPVAVVFIYSEGPFQVSRVGRKQRAPLLCSRHRLTLIYL